MSPVLVAVGAGAAGTSAALAARHAGWDGAIVLLTGDDGPGYERPVLSKQLGRGGGPARIPVVPAQRLADAGVQLRTAARLVELDLSGTDPVLHHRDGTGLAAQRVVLATGSRPLRLSGAIDPDGVALALRDWSDAVAVDALVRRRDPLLVVGAGFVGLEVAAAARAAGAPVVVVDPAPQVAGRGLPAPVAGLLAQRHRAAGVDLRLGVAVRRLGPTAGGAVAELDDGTVLEVAGVVAGVGSRAVTEYAPRLVGPGGGFTVDATGATAHPGVWAAGDVAHTPLPALGTAGRVEHWPHALAHGRTVGANAATGGSTPHTALPWLYTEAYGVVTHVHGSFARADRTVFRRVTDADDFCALGLRGGRLVAVAAAGGLPEARRLATLIGRPGPAPDPRRLADPAVAVPDLVRPLLRSPA